MLRTIDSTIKILDTIGFPSLTNIKMPTLEIKSAKINKYNTVFII